MAVGDTWATATVWPLSDVPQGPWSRQGHLLRAAGAPPLSGALAPDEGRGGWPCTAPGPDSARREEGRQAQRWARGPAGTAGLALRTRVRRAVPLQRPGSP